MMAKRILIPIGCLLVAAVAAASEPPKAARHVVVYREEGRFAGWPANHGIWSWGDEILVGFSRGTDKDRGPFHHIDHDRPEEFLLARSRDGGETWAVERPNPPGALAGTAGMRHGKMPADLPDGASRPARSADGFHPPGLRHDPPDGELQQRCLAILLLRRPRPHLAGPIRPAALRPARA